MHLDSYINTFVVPLQEHNINEKRKKPVRNTLKVTVKTKQKVRIESKFLWIKKKV